MHIWIFQFKEMRCTTLQQKSIKNMILNTTRIVLPKIVTHRVKTKTKRSNWTIKTKTLKRLVRSNGWWTKHLKLMALKMKDQCQVHSTRMTNSQDSSVGTVKHSRKLWLRVGICQILIIMIIMMFNLLMTFKIHRVCNTKRKIWLNLILSLMLMMIIK